MPNFIMVIVVVLTIVAIFFILAFVIKIYDNQKLILENQEQILKKNNKEQVLLKKLLHIFLLKCAIDAENTMSLYVHVLEQQGDYKEIIALMQSGSNNSAKVALQIKLQEVSEDAFNT